MSVPHITDDQFEAEVLKSKLPVLVDFYAEWCGPCKLAAPILDELGEEYKGKLKILKLDVDQSQLASKYGVMSIPTVVFFNNGEEVSDARIVGFGGKGKYVDGIKKVVTE